MTLFGPWAQWTPHAPAMNIWNLSYFVTGTYTNMKSGCHHHQIGMDYLWAPFSKWPPAKWNYVFVYNSASRIYRNKILLLSEVILRSLANLWSLPQLHEQESMALETSEIIVRGPAVTQNKFKLMHVMNEVWYSDAFAPKFVLRKVFSINIYM